MDMAIVSVKDKASKGRALYRSGSISQGEAKDMVQPYLDAVNSKAKELAKKYKQRPRTVSFRAFCR